VDIVITNPPFSLFREYVSILMNADVQFLILGSQNAITYKETFALIQQNKMWTGVDNGGKKWFEVPAHYENNTPARVKIVAGVKYFSLGSVYWFTNLDVAKRHTDITLSKVFSEHKSDYPYYDGYDAINVDKVADIPSGFAGKMGVPITFIDKYSPSQFEIIGLDRYTKGNPSPGRRLLINGKEKYARVIIRVNRRSK
jgi:hypothetical protein